MADKDMKYLLPRLTEPQVKYILEMFENVQDSGDSQVKAIRNALYDSLGYARDLAEPPYYND